MLHKHYSVASVHVQRFRDGCDLRMYAQSLFFLFVWWPARRTSIASSASAPRVWGFTYIVFVTRAQLIAQTHMQSPKLPARGGQRSLCRSLRVPQDEQEHDSDAFWMARPGPSETHMMRAPWSLKTAYVRIYMREYHLSQPHKSASPTGNMAEANSSVISSARFHAACEVPVQIHASRLRT